MKLMNKYRKRYFLIEEENCLRKYGEYMNSEYDISAFDIWKENIEKEFIENGNAFILKEGNTKSMLMKFYQFIDELNIIFHPYSPCKNKCSDCCFIHVAINELEISIIYDFIINNKLKYKKIKPKEILVEDKYDRKYFGKKCPFLKNGICLIYSVRPLVCRKLIVLEEDNSKCKYLTVKEIKTMNDDYIIKIISNLFIKKHRKGNGQDTLNNSIILSYCDIREIFKKRIW